MPNFFGHGKLCGVEYGARIAAVLVGGNCFFVRAHETAPDRTAKLMAKSDQHREAIGKLLDLYKDTFLHDGYGDIRVEMRFLRKGQKEVIIHCGKQYRFVMDYPGDGVGFMDELRGKLTADEQKGGRMRE